MAYNKTTWQTGDVITAEKLNNMEGGIEAAYPLVLTASGTETETLSATLGEIIAAMSNRVIYLYNGDETHEYDTIAMLSSVEFADGVYSIYFSDASLYFYAQNMSDYPTTTPIN